MHSVSPGNLRQKGNVVGTMLLGDLQRAYPPKNRVTRVKKIGDAPKANGGDGKPLNDDIPY